MPNRRYPPRILRGPSAYRIFRFVIAYTFGAVAVMLIGAAIMGVDPDGPIRYPAFFLMFVPPFSVAAILFWGFFREIAEAAEGYTTLQSGKRQLVQCDPYLGEVIREAGEDPLESEAFRRIRDLAKAKYAHMHSR